MKKVKNTVRITAFLTAMIIFFSVFNVNVYAVTGTATPTDAAYSADAPDPASSAPAEEEKQASFAAAEESEQASFAAAEEEKQASSAAAEEKKPAAQEKKADIETAAEISGSDMAGTHTDAEPAPAVTPEEEQELYGDGEHSHDGITFTAWTDAQAEAQYNKPEKTAANSLPVQSGAYYLTEDVILPEGYSVDADISICLNGHSITEQTTCMYVHGGTLNLYDCQGTGRIVNDRRDDSRGKDGTIYVYTNCVLNMYGGTLYGEKYGVRNNGTFNMYGGTITGGIDFAEDGAWQAGVYAMGGTSNIYGGTITGNNEGHGDILVEGGGLNLYGGEIGEIYVKKGKKITVPGQLQLPGKPGVMVFTVQGSSITASYGVFTSGYGAGNTADPADMFTSLNPDYEVCSTKNGEAALLKAIDPSVSITGWAYGEYDAQENSPEVTGNTGNGDVSFVYKEKNAEDSTYTEDIPSAAGQYTVKAIVSDTEEYGLAECTADFEITRRKVKFIWNGDTFDYDGTDKMTEAAVSNAEAGDQLILEYEDNTKTDAGSYTAKVVSLAGAAADNYELDDAEETVSHDWKINKAPLTIKAEDQEISYGEDCGKNSVAYDGFLGNDTEAVLKGELTFTVADDQGEPYAALRPAGSYHILPAGLEADNYEITFEEGTLTVNKLPGGATFRLAVSEDAGTVTVDNKPEELVDGLLTDEDRQLLSDGAEIEFYMEISGADPSSEDAEKIRSAAGNDTIGKYYEINLFKKITGRDAVKVEEVEIPISFTFTIPEEILNTDENVTRKYSLIMLHKGESGALSCTVDGEKGTLTSSSDRFSLYAITYLDAKRTDPDSDKNSSADDKSDSKKNSGTDDKSGSKNGSDSQNNSARKDKSAKTGDAMDPMTMVLIMIFALEGAAIVVVMGKLQRRKEQLKNRR